MNISPFVRRGALLAIALLVTGFAIMLSVGGTATVLAENSESVYLDPTPGAAKSINAPVVPAMKPVAPRVRPVVTDPTMVVRSSVALRDIVTYQSVIIAEPSVFRFQLSRCSAIPGELTVPRMQPLYLDNRDGVARTIAVADRLIPIDPYGFVAVQISEPGKYVMTCDGGGAGQITVL